ncbi:MAG: DUF86 domain-containing protein [Roseofilum sp. SBFL]|uniref:HepT-like ribonuclease domain-containing protein n=1 Tax=unclassified Roseofilum TaxID=2620099 RepID=UPI001AFDEC64|nr:MULTISPECIES: HepT-like ribonuclease domain-containing protein [unclassified Roseofilum]MBP0012972.1 DUF86 domain-containing protein [Roseofilum sp. SID3]MBP0022540.1 DUF86 domain-containing protein [Roseofilum sp. SID2]MBP0039045.1 DUF86 domain-containing protein [Roseofilum sp. SID1]MBP0040454.1 DUF86 domain-containing protein [Roseofilum sp. SBFL]
MLDAAKEACGFTQGKTRASLDSDRMLTLSLIKLIEIIGEAASRVSKEKQAELSELPWSQIISMRNRLIHAYFDIDLDILWQTVYEDLNPLITELEKEID